MAIKYYRNPDSTDFFLGVPSTDITDEDYASLESSPKADLDAYLAHGGTGWATTPYMSGDVPPKTGAEDAPAVLHPALSSGAPPAEPDSASVGPTVATSEVSSEGESQGAVDGADTQKTEDPPPQQTGRNRVGRVGENDG